MKNNPDDIIIKPKYIPQVVIIIWFLFVIFKKSDILNSLLTYGENLTQSSMWGFYIDIFIIVFGLIEIIYFLWMILDSIRIWLFNKEDWYITHSIKLTKEEHNKLMEKNKVYINTKPKKPIVNEIKTREKMDDYIKKKILEK